MIALLKNTDCTDTYFAVQHAMAAEAAKGHARVLSQEEIDALNAQGAFTDPRSIPDDHGFKRVSFPKSRRCKAI